MQRFIISTFFFNSSVNHSFKSKFTTSFYHSNHQNTFIKEFLFRNFFARFSVLFKIKFTSVFTPSKKVNIFVCPVYHHSFWEFTTDNIIHVFLIKWSKQFFNLFWKFISLNFCRIWKTVHHICNSTPFKSFTNNVPTVHQKFCSIFRTNSFFNHFVVTNNCSRLKHTTKNCLFAHKVRFYFCNKRRFQNTSFRTTHTNSQSLSISPTFSFWVIFWVNSNQIWNTKATFKFVVNFSSRTFWRTHNNSNIRTNLHSFFNHVKSMRIPKCCTFFHFLLNFCNNRSVLFIWS